MVISLIGRFGRTGGGRLLKLGEPHIWSACSTKQWNNTLPMPSVGINMRPRLDVFIRFTWSLLAIRFKCQQTVFSKLKLDGGSFCVVDAMALIQLGGTMGKSTFGLWQSVSLVCAVWLMTWLNSRLTDAGIIGSGTAKQSVLAKRVNQRQKRSKSGLHCRRYIFSKALTAWGSSLVPRKSISDAKKKKRRGRGKWGFGCLVIRYLHIPLQAISHTRTTIKYRSKLIYSGCASGDSVAKVY